MNPFFPSYGTYRITSPFGMRTLNGVTRMHNGIDLVAKTPTGGSATDYITAHTGGTVQACGYSSSAGNFVNLQTDPDTRMVYYHLRDKPALCVGDTVRTGDVIGYMGATGNTTGAHLHFGIRHQGQWIDPAPYLDCSGAQVEETGEKIPLATIQSGAKGEQVKAAQLLLAGRGFGAALGAADGSFGPRTRQAAMAFQKARGLAADGIIGPLTWKALLGVS